MDISAFFVYRGRYLTFRATVTDMARFRDELRALTPVDTPTWLRAMPPSVVNSADSGEPVRLMLTGIPLPPHFAAPFTGFHWCGYGLDAAVEQCLRDAGVVISARAPDAGVEAIERPRHPFFLATAFQPQVGAGDSGTLHPLIRAFLDAAGRPAGVGGAT